MKLSQTLQNVCSHPFLVEGVEDEIGRVEYATGKLYSRCNEDVLVGLSGKFVVFREFLSKLTSARHKVVIFVHEIGLMGLLQDYLNNHNYFYTRIDGSVRGEARETALEQFHAPFSLVRVLLVAMSSVSFTLDLQWTDAAVLFDTDWDSSNDHAIIRNCSSEVTIYRFICKATWEWTVFQYGLLLRKAQITHININCKPSMNNLRQLLLLSGISDSSVPGTQICNPEDVNPCFHELCYVKIPFNDSRARPHENGQVADDFWQHYDAFPGITDVEGGDDMDLSLPCHPPLALVARTMRVFGWGRWSWKLCYFDMSMSIEELRTLSKIVLVKILPGPDPLYPISSAILRTCHPNNLFPEIPIRIDRTKVIEAIEIMYFITQLVETCNNVPNGLALPVIPLVNFPFWDLTADRRLLHATYTAGYRQFTKGEFHIFETTPQDLLDFRLRQMMEEVKRRYVEFCRSEHGQFPFNHETCVMFLNSWTRRGQSDVVNLLLGKGWTGVDNFHRDLKFTRSEAELRKFVDTIFRACEGDREAMMRLPAPITPEMCNLIEERVKLFLVVEELCESRKMFSYNLSVLQHIKDVGFHALAEDEVIVSRFGIKNLEALVTQFIITTAAKADCSMPALPNLSSVDVRPMDEEAELAEIPAAPSCSLDDDPQDDPELTLPLTLRVDLVLINLGTIVNGRPGWRSGRYVYPAGFVSEKLSRSVVEAGQNAWYRSMIVDTGEPAPVFRVELKDDPTVCFSAPTHSGVWTIERGFAKLHSRRAKRLPFTTVSGPDYYGLSHPVTLRLIRRLPGVFGNPQE
jgi:chromodomain-helicase-DNA-binding protein 7